MATKLRYVARWALRPPADAEVDDGPDWRGADFQTLDVALSAARSEGRNGPCPDGWRVTEERWSPARDVRRSGRWVPTGRTWTEGQP
jgi:hypothetical protein